MRSRSLQRSRHTTTRQGKEGVRDWRGAEHRPAHDRATTHRRQRASPAEVTRPTWLPVCGLSSFRCLGHRVAVAALCPLAEHVAQVETTPSSAAVARNVRPAHADGLCAHKTLATQWVCKVLASVELRGWWSFPERMGERAHQVTQTHPQQATRAH